MLTTEEIMKIIPHRPPFLLVDRITELDSLKRAVGIKNVTMNEPFFPGHFPQFPVMPGVLIVEALAQVGAVALLSADEFKGRYALFAGLNDVRFRSQVTPGDTLTLQVEITRLKGTLGKGQAKAFVGDTLVCEGELMFAIVNEAQK